MPSYQDIETRLNVVERKIDFLMSIGTVTKREPSRLSPGDYIETQLSLLDLYKEVSNAGELENLTNGV